jgi:5-formyltetrahydrofolate cyclo-ligase
MTGSATITQVTTKSDLRADLRARRAALSPEEVRRGGFALSECLLADPRIEQAACVAVYASFGNEPSTRPLRAALRVRGVLVLVPFLLPDGGLDWVDDDRVVMAEPDAVDSRAALLHPAGDRLGVDALVRADVVVVPALAADFSGVRLGQGGGSYDRALLRIAPMALTVALLHPHEVLPIGSIPREPHDVPVRAIATGEGPLTDCGRGPTT